MKPLKPSEVVEKKLEKLPDEVIDAFNEMIALHWNGSYSKFKQEDVVNLILKKMDMERGDIFDSHYLDVEDIYRSEGWNVEYDKPAYYETYSATFEFSKGKS